MMIAIDAATNAGLTVYTIIEDPTMAPVAIISMLMGFVGGGSGSMGSRFRALSGAKGKMTKENKEAMGASYKENDPKIQSILGKICPGKRS
jgi:hypothetical protein